MKTGKKERLDAALRSGRGLSVEALAHHLCVDRNQAPRIAGAHGLAAEGSRFPWRRVWRQVHRVEGSHLAPHLSDMKARHPASVILAGIEDLEAALRAPLIDFATMAERMGKRPDTLAKALRQGRETLPFPTLQLGPRLRHYRPLEVRLWTTEEIRLDLPVAIAFPAPSEATPDTQTPEPVRAPCPAANARKALFGGFAGASRIAAT